MSYLVLIRHGISEYNVKGLWTGWEDPKLTKEGEEEVGKAAKTLSDLSFDIGFSSTQIRHKDTLDIIKKEVKSDFPIVVSESLRERNYGDFTGKNKWEIKKELGDGEFNKLRRGWNYPIPNGETLKQVYDRIVGYYKKAIEPELLKSKNVIISSSGNALRSLVKYLEGISDEDIGKLEIAPGEVYIYKLSEKGDIKSREIRNQHPNIV